MWQKSAHELREALSAPFQNSDIEWRVSATNHEKTNGLAVPYVTNRAIQTRLDDIVGIDGWHNDFVPWKGEKAQLCGISIYLPELKDWLTKWDGSDDTDIECVKGGLSDSMKRAAVEWGIGRYLYGMTPPLWVGIEQRGKGYVIRDAERPKLDAAHERWVQTFQQRKANRAGAPQTSQVSQGQAPQGQVQAPQGQVQPPQWQAQVPQGQNLQAQTPGSGTPGQTPVQPAPAAPNPQGIVNHLPNQQVQAGIPAGCYLVTGAVLKPTMSGNSRTSVQVRDSAGNLFQAYTRGADARLAPGLMLTNAQFSTQHNNGVTFYILESYQIMDLGGAQAA